MSHGNFIYARYVRYRNYLRIHKHSKFHHFLEEQAVRLSIAEGTPVAFTAANFALNQITVTGHGLATGDGAFQLTNTGGALPTGLATLTDYYVRVVDANELTLHPTYQDALDNTAAVAFSTAGTGTHSMTQQAVVISAEDIFNSMKAGKSADQIRQLTTHQDL